jgi:hypothetical protein
MRPVPHEGCMTLRPQSPKARSEAHRSYDHIRGHRGNPRALRICEREGAAAKVAHARRGEPARGAEPEVTRSRTRLFTHAVHH